jgi:hypothetical protein
MSTNNRKILTLNIQNVSESTNKNDFFRSYTSSKGYIAGGMAEWLKAAVLKTVECNSSVGSNPTPSATFSTHGSTA